MAATLLCAEPALAAGPSCFDGEKNGPESDVDCGGDCPPCDYGDTCLRARDCASGLCVDGECSENPYTPGTPVPPGYRVEVSDYDAAASARKVGLLFFGLSYGGAYVAALSLPGRMSWMYAPVLGPWLALKHEEDEGLEVLIIADGVLQAAGAALIIGGVAGRGYRLVRNEQTTVYVTPEIRPHAYGVSLGGAF